MRGFVSEFFRRSSNSWLHAGVRSRFSQDAREEESFAGTISPDGILQIEGVNGTISAEGVDGNQFVVRALKHGRTGDLRQVKLEFVQEANFARVRAVYPRGLYRRCRVDVDFTVQVPRTATLVATTVNGDIQARSVSGHVKAVTVNGGIRILDAHQGEARSINGAVEAELVSSNWKKPLHFKTVNGAMRIELPNAANAEIYASTVNGSVNADLPLVATRTRRRNLLDGHVGNLEHYGQMLFESLNGSIVLSCRKPSG
jgi:DUF4097 and DUF4098 domain-containing protein YvlB